MDRNGPIKYACEPCIRGHRASKCRHENRVLRRIKRPGRPFKTCPHTVETCCCLYDVMAVIKDNGDSIYQFATINTPKTLQKRHAANNITTSRKNGSRPSSSKGKSPKNAIEAKATNKTESTALPSPPLSTASPSSSSRRESPSSPSQPASPTIQDGPLFSVPARSAPLSHILNGSESSTCAQAFLPTSFQYTQQPSYHLTPPLSRTSSTSSTPQQTTLPPIRYLTGGDTATQKRHGSEDDLGRIMLPPISQSFQLRAESR